MVDARHRRRHLSLSTHEAAMTDHKAKSALKLFEDFTGSPGKIEGTIQLPYDDTLVIVGECEAIAYNATRDGETHSYQHEFLKASRPVLAVSHDGQRLYLLAGAYKFTHRGIEDR